MPPIFAMSSYLKITPLYFGNPVAMGCNHSYFLPVGTPPNAIIAGYANIRNKDLILTGSFVKISNYLLLLLFPLCGSVLWPIYDFPSWAVMHKTSVKVVLPDVCP